MDDADRADLLIQEDAVRREQEARKRVAEMPKGQPGDCDLCGEWSGRLVGGVCAHCRDLYKLP